MLQNQQVVGIAVTTRGREILGQIPFLTIHDPIDDLRVELGKLWHKYTTIVFCLPLEKVVKLIADYLTEEPQPNVIVINSQGTHVISVIGESQLVHQIADLLHAQPIGADITEMGIKPADQWGLGWGWRLGKGDWRGINQSLHNGEKISILQEVGSELWKRALPEGHSLVFYPSENVPQVFISHRFRNLEARQAQWHPRVLWLGLVCAPDTPPGLISQAIQTACQIHYLADLAIAGIASSEPNDRLAEIAQERGWLYQSGLGTPDPEALACAAAGKDAQLLAHRQVFHHSHQQGEVAIAIALAPQEYIGKEGYLSIIPSKLENLTLKERNCFLQAEVIMAEFLPDQFRYGKIVEPIINYPQAVALARMGLNVALVNDRADLVFAHLLDQGWGGRNPRVEVVPGVSQIQHLGAKLGIVLQENFCVINLHGGEAGEGILQRRIETAAISDLVLAILEPCTPLRLTPLILSLEILRHYRSVTTPVAIIKGDKVTITQLKDIDIKPIDRDTVIFVGNEFTQFLGW